MPWQARRPVKHLPDVCNSPDWQLLNATALISSSSSCACLVSATPLQHPDGQLAYTHLLSATILTGSGAGTLGSLLEHHQDAPGDHALPLSPSEINLAAWAHAGTSVAEAAGDLASIPRIPRNFSLSDLTFDQEGLPRITSLADLAAFEQGRCQASQTQQQQQQTRQED